MIVVDIGSGNVGEGEHNATGSHALLWGVLHGVNPNHDSGMRVNHRTA